MADRNVEGHLDVLLRIWTSSPWNELWQELSCDIESFLRFGIGLGVSDVELWRICQQGGILLLTGNRNTEEENSLR